MTDDILGDAAALFGETTPDDSTIYYGPLSLTVAPKEGKANTLLADHLFSPSLLLAERLERGLIPVHDQTVIELGAGCALPSLLASTLARAPALVTITDYPDETILDNLRQNVSRNSQHVSPGCVVHCTGYEWGRDVTPLLSVLPLPDPLPTGSAAAQASAPAGYDVAILSDLLHFDRSHDELLGSLTRLLRRTPAARAYVAAGKYTPPHVCTRFLRAAEAAGLVWDEGEDGGVWLGGMEVHGAGLDRAQLGVRKGMCRWWTGRWAGAARSPP